jgi:hypothetical protein
MLFGTFRGTERRRLKHREDEDGPVPAGIGARNAPSGSATPSDDNRRCDHQI